MTDEVLRARTQAIRLGTGRGGALRGRAAGTAATSSYSACCYIIIILTRRN